MCSELSEHGDQCLLLHVPHGVQGRAHVRGVGASHHIQSPKQISIFKIPFLPGRNLGQILWLCRLVTALDFLVQTWSFSPGGSVTPPGYLPNLLQIGEMLGTQSEGSGKGCFYLDQPVPRSHVIQCFSVPMATKSQSRNLLLCQGKKGRAAV